MDATVTTRNLVNLNSLYSYGEGEHLDLLNVNYSVQIYIPFKSSVYLYLQDEDNNIIMNIINGEILEQGFYTKKIDLSKFPNGVYHYRILINGDSQIKTLFLRK